MAIKTNFISESTLARVTSLAFRGHVDPALLALNNSELNEAQKQKIKVILQEPLPAYTINAAQKLKERIIAVISKDSVLLNDTSATAPGISSTSATNLNEPVSSSHTAHIASSEQENVFSFADISTAPFAMAYPSAFEFGGKQYQNATACFLAQQYTDQPDVMNLFTTVGAEQASALAECTPMTENRKLTWENPDAEHVNKDDVLMHVQRQKFEQNPELKKELLATGSAYLVCQGHGLYLTDNFNGAGENALGNSLMRLRGEYGGTALVAPPTTYLGQAQSQQERSITILDEIPIDIMGVLFEKCIDQSDWETLKAFPYLNKRWNQFATTFWEGLDLKVMCPELTIIDAKAQGIKCDDEPKISKLTISKWVKKIATEVEENAGVTQLTLAKGTTLNQLIEIATHAGIKIDIPWELIIEELGNVPVEQTYVILITNSVFNDSRNKVFNLQKTLVEGHGCEMPTVQEYVALFVFTRKIFNKSLYGQKYGLSSTHVQGSPVFVGDSNLKYLYINTFEPITSDKNYYGAGGGRKFGH